MNRNFRNEGISRRHNPEFTMLEIYWAYANFERMAQLVEELICHLAEKVTGTLNIAHRDDDGTVRRAIHLQRPWRRARYVDLIRAIDADWFERSREEKVAKCQELGVEIQPAMQEF